MTFEFSPFLMCVSIYTVECRQWITFLSYAYIKDISGRPQYAWIYAYFSVSPFAFHHKINLIVDM